MAAVAPQADLRSARIRNGGTWLAIAALALAITGCNDSGRTATVWVGNNTDVTLHFAIIDAHGKPFELRKKAAPGDLIGLIEGSLLSPDAGIMIDACTVGDLIAYDPAGREVARHPPGLCARTKDVWTIGPPASPQPSG